MSGLVLRTLGEVFGASWAVLAVFLRPLGTSWAVFWGIPEAPDAPRPPKAYRDGFTLAGRAKRASERSERSERSDQDETALAEHKRRRRNSNGAAGARGVTQHFTEVYIQTNVFHMRNFIADDSPTSTRFPFMLKQVPK